MGNPFDEVGKKTSTRPVHVFDVPAPLANGIQNVGMVELTADEELQATKRARGDTHRLAYELVKQSLAEVNGEKVGLADGSSESAWNNMSPKVRNLMLGAYAELHAPPDGANEDFLKSRRVKVG